MARRSPPLLVVRHPMRASGGFWFPPLVVAGLLAGAMLHYRVGITIDGTAVPIPLVLSVLAALALLFPLLAWIRRAQERLLIHTDRVELVHGLLRKERRTLALNEIQTIDVHQRFSQRMLGMGDLAISGKGGKVLAMRQIGGATSVQETIEELRSGRYTDPAAASAPATSKKAASRPAPSPEDEELAALTAESDDDARDELYRLLAEQESNESR